MTLGQKIKYRRQDLGLYQDELAELTGITQSQICKIKTNKSKPSFEVLVAISKALKCDLNYLTEEVSAWAESLMTSI